MHPAIYQAMVDSRETELRAARHHERPAPKPRVRLRFRVALRARRVRAA
jgi:hypothetical protein